MTSDHDWDFLSEREAHFVQSIIDELRPQEWATSLLAIIEAERGLTRATKSFLFELRFGHALQSGGIQPRYEIPGEGDSTLDFGFNAGGYDWQTELMRLEESDAVRRATKTATDADGVLWAETHLATTNSDRRQSEEGETLKAIERICQKCERSGSPHKFALPEANSINVLLVDMRLFALGANDPYDYALIALGCAAVPEFCKRYYNGQPISGAFEESNGLRGAENLRERVHFIGFVREKEYASGAFSRSIAFVANPSMFASVEEAQRVINAWPLQPATLLNGMSASA